MMAALAGSPELYLIDSVHNPSVLVTDSDNVPVLVEPQPSLLRAVYLSANFLDTQLAKAQERLNTPECDLFAPMQCPDGPPYRSGRLFTFQSRHSAMSWLDEKGHSRFGAEMRRFRVVTPFGPYIWTQQAREGQGGYFLTGLSGHSALWRLFRLESDALGHQLFTIAPVRISPGCPLIDFSSVSDPVLRAEVTIQYGEFCQRVSQNAYRDILTKARNLVEALVSDRLRQQGNQDERDLGRNLVTVKGLLEDARLRASCGWSYLDYHLAHKIRLLHGQTHATSVANSGSPIRPEFALTVVEDLGELLRRWGYSPSDS